MTPRACRRRCFWGLHYTVGSALLGLGVGMVVRHSAGAAAGLPNALHAAIFWGYVIVALALGAVLLVRRDADG
ncbi:MAG: hypothetical protein ACOYOQ_12755 [Microthrixaceae bacterium]